MKLHTILSAGALALAVAVPVAFAGAGTIAVSPATKSVSQGQTFTMTVAVDPVSSTYTAKAVVTYPANLLEVKSFVFASQWLPLTQPGYDSIDNASGTLIKTAGYPGGLSTAKTLGTITFKAKAAGTATIQAGAGSMLLNASNANEFTAGGKATVTVRAPAAVVAPASSPTASPEATVTEVPASGSQESSDLTARIDVGGNGKTWRLMGLGALGIVVIFGIVRWFSRPKQQ